MRTRISNLPKTAVYDYTDIFGNKVYHTARRRYEVTTKKHFGKTMTYVYSMDKED